MKKALTFLEIMMVIIIVGIISGFLLSHIKPKRAINSVLVYSTLANLREYNLELMARKEELDVSGYAKDSTDKIYTPSKHDLMFAKDFKYQDDSTHAYNPEGTKYLYNESSEDELHDGSDDQFCLQYTDLINTAGKIDCTRNKDVQIKLANGVEIKGLNDTWTQIPNSDLYYKFITFDINGFKENEQPNVYDSKTKKGGQFVAILYSNGHIQLATGMLDKNIAKFKVLKTDGSKYVKKPGTEDVVMNYCEAMMTAGYRKLDGSNYDIGLVSTTAITQGISNDIFKNNIISKDTIKPGDISTCFESANISPDCTEANSCKVILLPDNVTSMLGGAVMDDIEF